MRTVPRLAHLAVAPLALALTGCGTERLGASPPDHAELVARASAAQTRVEHVYVTEAEGFTLARQSAGVIGDDGFRLTYVAKDGARLTLSAERQPFTDKDCSAPSQGETCAREDGSWYRHSAYGHTYVRNEGALRITLGAPLSVSRETLRETAARAHRADDAELDAVLPEETGPRIPVERGDLPPEGDGAPDNSVGVGG
ncbi:hypothetical protein [Streptomyces sp. NBC_01216]|uniref:hypothetical protein n=1 Tax=unclassified Streptomyces TaxID=2593676 RepID=UPI002E153217|nr:hypothetical protein OG393_09750 [Streptomyces sp. NBC_01216]